MIVIDITPARAEPYTITTFSKYQTTPDDPLKPDGTVDHPPPASDTPAQRLDKYICAKLAEKYLILLQFHTGPQQSHFGSITASITPLKEGFHDYCTPVTSPSNDVVADILAVKGFPVEPTPTAMATDAHGDGAAASCPRPRMAEAFSWWGQALTQCTTSAKHSLPPPRPHKTRTR